MSLPIRIHAHLHQIKLLMSKNVQPTVFVGIDWGSAAHQVCVFSSESKILGEKEFLGWQKLSYMINWQQYRLGFLSEVPNQFIFKCGATRINVPV